MYVADVLMVIVRAVAAITVLTLLALGSFKSDAGTALAVVVALTTTAGAAHTAVHAKTCEGHGDNKP